MKQPSELEAQEVANSFRPNLRPILFTLGANLAMAILLLGVPYWRGREIARAERPAFARFTQCLLGGEIPSRPGLGLPDQERDHYASNVLFASSQWPLGCRKRLHELAAPDAIFLWPAVKEAGVDVRAVVKLLDGELAMLHRARRMGSARVPSRPLLALAKLQAALTLMAKAAGAEADIDDYALRFKEPAKLSPPARLPLMAAETSTLDLLVVASTLEAVALDGRGASWLRVDAGKIDRDRVKRTSLVRAVVRAGSDPYLVWATPQARCLERDDHCARRATGLAAYDKGGVELPTPQWLAGHPAQRVDRSLRVDPAGRVDLLALTQDGSGIELRRFRLDKTVKPVADAPPVQPEQSWPVAAACAGCSAVLTNNESPGVVYAGALYGQVTAHVVHVAPVASDITLPQVPGEAPWVLSCTAADVHWVAYGSHDGYRVARLAADGGVVASDIVAQTVDAPLHAENAALDRVRLSCDGHGSQLWTLGADATLGMTTCSADGHCAARTQLGEQVASFSALTLSNSTLVAWSGTGSAREIRVLRTDLQGKVQAPAQTPATCWDPFGGFCGVPVLAHDGARVVLAAREGNDLLAIESTDGGEHFVALQGVQVSRALDTSAHDPLQQHRIRKGID